MQILWAGCGLGGGRWLVCDVAWRCCGVVCGIWCVVGGGWLWRAPDRCCSAVESWLAAGLSACSRVSSWSTGLYTSNDCVPSCAA
eukprot:3525434-Amphidinium_carterae.1